MKYRRDEAFRFEFGEPVPLLFTIDSINGKTVDSSDGEAQMLDLSLNGMKLATSLEIPVDRNEVLVTTRFSINNHSYEMIGKLVWMEKVFDLFQYGVQFSLSDETQEDLLYDLKIIAKQAAERL